MRFYSLPKVAQVLLDSSLAHGCTGTAHIDGRSAQVFVSDYIDTLVSALSVVLLMF